LKLQFGQNRGWNWASARRSNFFFLACKIEIFVDALHDGGLEACDLVKFVEKILQLAVEGVRNTNVEAGLARSGTVAGSLWQLANKLTTQELQTWKRRTGTNTSPVKKLAYLFGEFLAKIASHGSRPTCRAAFVFLTSDAYLPSRRCVSTQRTACRTISALVVNSIFSLM
jgi:hypothetical protein